MDVLLPLVSILVFVTTLLLLAFGLFSAPWQLLLIFLVIGLLGIRKLMELNHLTSVTQQLGPVDSPQPSPEQIEQAAKAAAKAQSLTYRGAPYNPTSAEAAIAQTNSTEVSGKYRGGIWKKSPDTTTQSTGTPKSVTGKYRGCTWKSES